MAKLDHLFDVLLEEDGSDLHLQEGQKPKIRQYGNLVDLEEEAILHHDDINELLRELCDEKQWKTFLKTKDLDFSYRMKDIARFRANYFFQQSGMGAVFRSVPHSIRTFEELNLPSVLQLFAEQRTGLILITGPTGSGKTTTMAALLDYMNERYNRYILTIEDPIEFVHDNKLSFFCQREIGKDVLDFADALRSTGRVDCDVVMVGEMRDYETISLALAAASMGKLVLGALHTNSAIKTIDRIIDVFPAEDQWKARNLLADTLYGVCAQVIQKILTTASVRVIIPI